MTGAGHFRVPVYGLYGEAERSVGYGFLHVEPLAIRNAPNAWQIQPHLHPDIEQISLVLEGGCKFEIDNASFHASGTSVVYMPANTVHSFDYEPATRGFIISISRDFLNGMTQANPLLAASHQRLSQCRGETINGDLRRLEMICSMLTDYSPQGNGSASLEASYLFYHFWLLLDRMVARDLALGNDLGRSRELDLFDRLRSSIEEQFRFSEDEQAVGEARKTRRTVDYFASQLGVSVFQLNNCAQRAVGKSVSELIREATLAEATRLLLYTDIPIKDISDFLGYSSSSHFIRFFKRAVEQAPDAFRQRNTIFAREGGS